MAVDLPPPVPPEQGTVQQGDAVAAVGFQDYSIQVLGSRVLGKAAIEQAIAGADTLSNAVRALASAYYAAGYPAARLAYSLADKTLYVTVTLGGVTTVEGGGPAHAYLKGLAGQAPLTDQALEPRRTLASIHADRAGLSLISQLTPDAAGNSQLTLKPGPDLVDPTTVRVEVGNPGNRFVGRYFIDFDLRTGSRWGDEFRALARSGQHGFSETESDYFEQNLGWSRVTPWGIFGAGGRYVDYTFVGDVTTGTTTTTEPVNGNIWFGEAYWLYPLLADFNSRLTLQGKVDRTSKTGDIADDGTTYQREIYTSVEAGAAYQRNLHGLGMRWDIDAGLAIRKGLADEESALTNANQDYLLYRPALRLRSHLTERYSLALELSGQFTSDPLPEQQQWVLGGQGNLTSALPGVAVGDQGYLLRLVGEATAFELYGLSLTPKVFVETGEADLELDSTKPSLADVGFEIGVKVFDWLEGSLAYAEAITDKDLSEAELDGADANLFFRLQAKF